MRQTWPVLQTLRWSLKGESEIPTVRQSSSSELPAGENKPVQKG